MKKHLAFFSLLRYNRIGLEANMRNWLQNQYVILTGASSGIGKELCLLLIRKYGVNVIGVGRNEEKMQRLVQELGDDASHFSYQLFDVSRKENWTNFRSYLETQEISPVLLINNAGAFPSFDKCLNIETDVDERIMQNNFFSVVYACKTLAPILKNSGKRIPALVNIASSAALCTVSGTAAYSASKSAVKAFSETLQMEEQGRLYVGVVYPGTTATALFDGDENTKNSALDKVAMPAKKMAKKIAKRIYKRKKRSVVGWDAKLMCIVAKVAPVKGLALIRWIMKTSKSKVFTNVFDYE